MPPAIDAQTRAEVIKGWLSGSTRDEIAQENSIGAGTVSNILNEWKKGLDNLEYESLRELAVFSKKEAMTLTEVAANVRLNNYIQKSGANLEQIESFIENIANSQDPEKFIDIADQIMQLSALEPIPLDKIEKHIKAQLEEKQKLENEVAKAREILKQTNIDVQTVEEYKRLEEELQKSGLSTNDTQDFVSILKKFKKMRYNPREIVTELTRARSLRQHEKQLKNSCKILESRASKYKEIIPLCEQLLQLRIGIAELAAYHTAVMKKSDTENLPMGTAAYRVIEDIDNYNNVGGMKEQLIKLGMQKFMMDQILARQNKAIMSLIRLQWFGMDDNEIVNANEFLIRARSESGQNLINY